VDVANLVKRLYPIPPSVSTGGLHVVAIRVFHGRRSGSVFRSAPLIATFESLAAAQGRVDQTIALFLGLSTAAAIILLIFAWHAPAAREYPLFAILSFLLGLYTLTMHSGWRHWSMPSETPFRLSVFASSLVVVGYLEAMPRLLRVPPPRRFLVYDAAFGLLALAAAVLPESESLVVPTRVQPWLVLLALGDLSLSMARAFAARRRYAPSIVLGHLLFLAGGAAMGDVFRVGAGFVSNVDVGAVGLIAGWCVLAVTFLRSMSDQLARFRVAGLTDPGTKLWNRAALFDELAGRIDAARRGAGPAFGLVLADLDGFKALNDTRGHLAGDRLLARAARALVDASRGHDLVARYGGDEFAVIVDDVDGDSLPMVAARVHDALNSSLLAGTGEASVTASVGVAPFVAARHLTPESLLADADRALYDAKGRGKNRVEMYRPETVAPKRRGDSGVFRRLKKPSGDAPKPE
ncbi:MAG TPA: GGDEF domain-containing protein, partial [Thermoanaerobaculia bacterium]|nr:GGDEF domain-containing protein [Thermoanaerobaculia bacterium]